MLTFQHNIYDISRIAATFILVTLGGFFLDVDLNNF